MKICGNLYVNRTYTDRQIQTASLPNGTDGIVVLLDGYDAPLWLRYCNTVKMISSCKMKQMKARLI